MHKFPPAPAQQIPPPPARPPPRATANQTGFPHRLPCSAVSERDQINTLLPGVTHTHATFQILPAVACTKSWSWGLWEQARASRCPCPPGATWQELQRALWGSCLSWERLCCDRFWAWGCLAGGTGRLRPDAAGLGFFEPLRDF